jgi:hypothetical protein
MLVPETETGLHGTLDELTKCFHHAFRHKNIEHWQPFVLELLIDAVTILGTDVERPWLEQGGHTQRAFGQLDQQILSNTEDMEKAGNLRKRMQQRKVDPLQLAIKKIRSTANRKAKKRDKGLSMPALGTEVPDFFLISKNPVLPGLRSFEYTETVQGLNMNMANDAKVIHEVYQTRNALAVIGLLPPQAGDWKKLNEVAYWFGEHALFLGSERPNNWSEIILCSNKLFSTTTIGD